MIPGIVPESFLSFLDSKVSPLRIRTGTVNICVREKNFPRAEMDEEEGPRDEGGSSPLKERVYRFVVLRFYKGRRGNELRYVVKLLEHSGTRVADFDTVVKRNVKETGWRCPTSDVSRRMRRNVDVVTRNRCPSSLNGDGLLFRSRSEGSEQCLEIFYFRWDCGVILIIST